MTGVQTCTLPISCAAKEAAGDIEEHDHKEWSDKGFTCGPYKRSNNVIDTGDSGASMEAATGGKRKRGKENGPAQKKRKVKSSRIIQSDCHELTISTTYSPHMWIHRMLHTPILRPLFSDRSDSLRSRTIPGAVVLDSPPVRLPL